MFGKVANEHAPPLENLLFSSCLLFEIMTAVLPLQNRNNCVLVSIAV